jgi:dual 3',5'-cyclic-AMP and -GMP phosphodiesterase 11
LQFFFSKSQQRFQVDFIDSICLPVYNCFAGLSEALHPLRDGCLANKKEWSELAQKEEDFWDKKD